MSKRYIEDQFFENLDFSENELPKANYENCTFINKFAKRLIISTFYQKKADLVIKSLHFNRVFLYWPI